MQVLQRYVFSTSISLITSHPSAFKPTKLFCLITSILGSNDLVSTVEVKRAVYLSFHGSILAGISLFGNEFFWFFDMLGLVGS